jgi:hypothetical protein
VKRTTTRGCAGALIPGSWPSLSAGKKRTTHGEKTKEVGRNFLLWRLLLVWRFRHSGSIFIGQSVKIAGKKTCKAAKAPAQDTDRAGAVVKFFSNVKVESPTLF